MVNKYGCSLWNTSLKESSSLVSPLLAIKWANVQWIFIQNNQFAVIQTCVWHFPSSCSCTVCPEQSSTWGASTSPVTHGNNLLSSPVGNGKFMISSIPATHGSNHYHLLEFVLNRHLLIWQDYQRLILWKQSVIVTWNKKLPSWTHLSQDYQQFMEVIVCHHLKEIFILSNKQTPYILISIEAMRSECVIGVCLTSSNLESRCLSHSLM